MITLLDVLNQFRLCQSVGQDVILYDALIGDSDEYDCLIVFEFNWRIVFF